jgi:hypothetical protein
LCLIPIRFLFGQNIDDIHALDNSPALIIASVYVEQFELISLGDGYNRVLKILELSVL